MTVSNLLEQPCNKSDNPSSLLQVVNSLFQTCCNNCFPEYSLNTNISIQGKILGCQKVRRQDKRQGIRGKINQKANVLATRR